MCSYGAYDAVTGKLLAETQQHGEVKAAQGVVSTHMDARSAQAECLALAGPAALQTVPAAQHWLGDDISSDGERQPFWNQVLEARPEAPTTAAAQSAVPLQTITSATMQPPMHLIQQGQPDGTEAPALLEAKGQQEGSACVPKGLNADTGGPTEGTGWIGSHLRELGLADAVEHSAHQPATAAPVSARRSCGNAHAMTCTALMPQAVVLQATSAVAAVAVGRHPVTAAEMLRLPPSEHDGPRLAILPSCRDTAMPRSSNAVHAVEQGFPSLTRPADKQTVPPAVSAGRQLGCLPAIDPPIADPEDRPVQPVQPAFVEQHVHGTDASGPLKRQAHPAPHGSWQDQPDLEQVPTEGTGAGSAPGKEAGSMGSPQVPAPDFNIEERHTDDVVGDVVMGSTGGSGADSDLDEALPVSYDKLPVSLGGLAHAGSSQR